MARLKLCGFETGDASELVTLVGTASIQSTVKRTGSYALRTNPTGGTGYAQIAGHSSSGISADLNVATLYERFYVYIASAPAADRYIWACTDTSLIRNFELHLSPSRSLQLQYWNGSAYTTAGSATTLSLNTWYRVEIKLQNTTTASGCSTELMVDGGSIATASGLNINGGSATNIAYTRLGTATASSTFDIYFDDVALDDAAYPGAGQVNILKPNATGSTSAWTNGAGTSPTNVAEVPHDSDTSYITSSTSGDVTTVNLDSSATGGVSGTIAAVQVVGIVRDTGGASSMSIRAKSSATNSDTTAVDPGTAYKALSKILTTDPNTSAAWTTSGLDALEIGVVNAANLAVRCTALYAMVESAGAVANRGNARTYPRAVARGALRGAA